jgi:hypothetical protein
VNQTSLKRHIGVYSRKLGDHMKILTTGLVFCILFAYSPAIFGQTDLPSPASAPTAPMAFGLNDGTPVKLRLGRTMSSAEAKTGETVDFEVLEDVSVGEVLLIARGTTALGTVTRAKPKGRMGKGGKLDIVLDSVRLVSGEKIALRASKETKGGSHTGAMTGAIVATSILFFPAAPLFLFMKGKDITIPKGTEITAYVNGDISLDRANFVTAEVPSVVDETKETATPTANSTISVKSDPDGADIEVDGRFIGSTPSTFQLDAGEHKIMVKRSGFVVWERTITLKPADSITVNASLEKLP